MNKDKIIKNLVKQHKKYHEYEAILDDIIDDVYTHSEVIINSVTNESVIEAYLQKVIATSMITVPKKLGVRKYVRPVVVTAVKEPEPIINFTHEEEQTLNTQEEITFETEDKKPEEIKVNTEYVDKMINLAETSGDEIDTKVDDNELLQITKEDEITDFAEEEIQDTAEPVVEETLETNLAFAEEPQITDEISEIGEIQDSAENGIFEELSDDENSAENTENLQEDDFISLPDEEEAVTIVDEEPTITEPEPFEFSASETDLESDLEKTENNEVNFSEDDFISENTDAELEIDDSSVTNTVSLDIVPPSENVLDIADIDEYQTDSNNQNIETAEELVIDEFVPINEELTVNTNEDGFEAVGEENLLSDIAIDSISDLTEVSESNLTLSEIESNEIFASETIDDLQNEDSSDSFLEEFSEVKTEKEHYLKTDCSVFAPSEDIIVQKEDIKEDVQKSVIELSEKYPGLNIINIFNLRYHQNYSVKQIAQELGIETTDVYTALSKISDVV